MIFRDECANLRESIDYAWIQVLSNTSLIACVLSAVCYHTPYFLSAIWFYDISVTIWIQDFGVV